MDHSLVNSLSRTNMFCYNWTDKTALDSFKLDDDHLNYFTLIFFTTEIYPNSFVAHRHIYWNMVENKFKQN